MTDQELLRRYENSNDQEAFAELVRRHVDLVYGVARRQMPLEAEDVTQAVFILLSQKPHQAGARRSVGGWLFQAARFCCTNARRMQMRRLAREQEAGRMKGETSNQLIDAEQREILLHQLDEAIAELPLHYREVVLMRYLQGKSLEETGVALGISAAAAGKITGRALGKLRVRFARAGCTLAAGTIAVLLAQEAAKGSPAALTHAITSTAGSAGAAGLAHAALAHGTGKAMALSGYKAAGSIAAIILLAGVIGWAIFAARWSSLLSAASIVHPVSTYPLILAAMPADDPVPVDDEKTISGRVCFASLMLVLDTNGADALTKATQKADIKSDFYDPRQADGPALHAALSAIQNNGQILEHGTIQFHALNTNPEISNGMAPLGMLGRANASGLVRGGRGFRVTMPEARTNHFFNAKFDGRLNGESAKIELNYQDAAIALEMVQLDPRGNALPPNQAPPVRLEKPVNIKWDTNLEPGKSIVLIGDYGPWQDDHLFQVTVVEIFKATKLEARYFGSIDADRWIAEGPTGLRHAVDPAIVWAAGGADPKLHDKWATKLSDGTVVSLVSISSPSGLPLQSWMPDGTPRWMPDTPPMIWGRPGSGGRQQRAPDIGLAGLVHIDPPTIARDRDDNFKRVITDATGRIHLYIGVGDWKIQDLPQGGSVKVGDETVAIRRIINSPTQINLAADNGQQQQLDIRLGVVTKHHQQLLTTSGTSWGAWNSVWRDNVGIGGPINVPPEEVDHYIVASRPRKEVVFDGFATVPQGDLPASVTREEVDAAGKTIAEAEVDEQWQLISKVLEKNAKLARNPSTPEGSADLMIDRAKAGDLAGVREFIVGENPAGCDAVATLVTTHGKALALAEKKFGVEALYRGYIQYDEYLPDSTGLPPGEWIIIGDKAADGWAKRVRHDGKWCYDAGSLKADALPMKSGITYQHALLDDLESGKITTAEEAARRLLYYRLDAWPCRTTL